MSLVLKEGSKGLAVRQIQKALHLYVDGIFGKLTAEAVKEFQRRAGLSVDGVVGPATLTRLLPELGGKSRRRITEIIVHCTATPDGKDYTVSDIRKWHRNQGWADIGYHYVIYRNGSINVGRSIDLVGAHCAGHNANSIGICYVGGCEADGKTPKDTRTAEQREALLFLLQFLRSIYPQASIRGHRDFANKACPSFDATFEYRYI